MEYAIGALAVVAIVGIWAFFCKRQAETMSDQHMAELRQGFLRLQKKAFVDITESEPNNAIEYSPSSRQKAAFLMELPSQSKIDRVSIMTCQRFSLVYTIEKQGEQFVHIVSGKAPGRPRKFTIASMLLVMLELSRQFEASGFTDWPKVEISESELGTHFIAFELDVPQQEALKRTADAAAQQSFPADAGDGPAES